MAKDTLAEYSAKRAFDATPEPPPAVARRAGPLLFVIQQHAATRLHFDLRLECDGVLKSWAVPKGPTLTLGEKRLGMQTEDHPFEYASFEGVIPRGQYGAGEVIVWDCGVYSPDEGGTAFDDRDAAEQRVREELAKGKLSVELRGEKVKGSFALVRMKDPKSWLLLKHRDRFATGEDLAARDRSVLSGTSVAEMATLPARRMPAARLIVSGKREALPAKLEPMHAETGERAFNDAGWSWEPKLDGYRVLAFIGAKGVRLQSRRGLDLSAAFPRLCEELAQQGTAGMVLDGEIVAFDEDGRASFNALQNRVQLRNARDIAAADRASPAVFVCFDLLHFAGIDVRAAPYRDRRRWLAQCLMPSRLVQLVHASEDGVQLHAAAVASGFEGVVAKRLDSRYEPGARSSAWLKVKATKSAEFVIGGYTQGRGARAPLGAILVGYWKGGKLHFASHVGSGFDDRSLAQVKARLEPLKAKACPFAAKPAQLNAPATWVEPKVVAEVEFQDWTGDGSLRAPVFVRIRDDIDAKGVKGKASTAAAQPAPKDEIADIVSQLENTKSSLTLAVGKQRIKLTNLDRVYWPANPGLRQPALAKRDLVRYLAQVSPYMLPHLAERPLTMIRMPEGIPGQRFFQKHWAQERPAFVETITVFSEHKDESHEYLLCNNLATLLWLAQSGTLEFHVWHSRAKPGPDAATQSTDFAASAQSMDESILNYPDYVVFDIDPYIYSGKEAPGAEPELNTVAFDKGKEVAFHLRELLATMSLEAIVKTSGKTGLHIFVPVCRTLTFDEARHVSEMVGRHLMAKHPKDITLEWKIPKRTGKIFMDYNMNVRGKTLNVAYSPRGEAGAPVSMPLTWDELERAHPLDFRLTNAAERLARTGDRWKDVFDRKQRFEEALSRSGR